MFACALDYMCDLTKKPQRDMNAMVAFRAEVLFLTVPSPPMMRRVAVMMNMPYTINGRRPTRSTKNHETMLPMSWIEYEI